MLPCLDLVLLEKKLAALQEQVWVQHLLGLVLKVGVAKKKTWMINQSKDYFWVVFLGNIAKQDPDQYFFLTNTYQIEFFFNKEINMV